MASGIETPPASLQTEAQNLKQRLDAIRNQYVGWTKKDCATMIQTMEEQSANLTDTALHNEKVIRQEIEDCKALLSDNKKKMSHEAEKEIKLTEELSAVAEKSDILLQQKEQLETEVKRRREDNQQQRELVTEKEASTGDVKQGLEKSAKFFRESLGLQFKKVSGGRLQVIFTLLDPQDPNQPFVFCVKINENSYTVTDVDPSIPQLPEYISKLNETNDFQRFIRNMRAAFKATLKS